MSLALPGARITRLHPFSTRYASNLAILFKVVYFVQSPPCSSSWPRVSPSAMSSPAR